MDDATNETQVLNDGEDVELVLNDNEDIDTRDIGGGMVQLTFFAPWAWGGNGPHEYDVKIEMTKAQAIQTIVKLAEVIQ